MLYIKMFSSFKANEALITDVSSEETEFLKKVKEKTPALYNRFYSMIKNRGLDTAKQEYLNHDPEYQKLLAKSNKKKATKENTWNLKETIKEVMPNRQQIKSLIEQYFFNADFVAMCKKYNLPQISPESFDPKVNINKYDGLIRINMKSVKYYEDIPFYIKSLKTQNPEKEIKRHEKEFKFMKKMKKYNSQEEEDSMAEFSYADKKEAFKITNSFTLTIRHDNRLISGRRGFEINSSFSSMAEGGKYFMQHHYLYNERANKGTNRGAFIEPEDIIKIEDLTNEKAMLMTKECLKQLSEKVLSKYTSIMQIMDVLDEIETDTES